MDAPVLVGPQFADIQPKDAAGALSPMSYAVPSAATGYESGTISRVTPYTAFTEGQDLLFWLSINIPFDGANGVFVNNVRLKLWWLRANVQFRTPGDPADGGWLGGASTTGTIDGTTFGGTTDDNNPNVWIPEERGIMLVPPVSSDRTTGYDMHDVFWNIRLPDPAGDASATRKLCFAWKAMGRALAFTGDRQLSGASQASLKTFVSVSYKTGWAGGSQVTGNAVI